MTQKIWDMQSLSESLIQSIREYGIKEVSMEQYKAVCNKIMRWKRIWQLLSWTKGWLWCIYWNQSKGSFHLLWVCQISASCYQNDGFACWNRKSWFFLFGTWFQEICGFKEIHVPYWKSSRLPFPKGRIKDRDVHSNETFFSICRRHGKILWCRRYWRSSYGILYKRITPYQ